MDKVGSVNALLCVHYFIYAVLLFILGYCYPCIPMVCGGLTHRSHDVFSRGFRCKLRLLRPTVFAHGIPVGEEFYRLRVGLGFRL